MNFRSALFLVFLICCMPLTAQSPAPAQNGTIRLALVNVPDELLRPMLPDFEKQAGLRAEIVYAGNDPFAAGREGKADLVISHYGHEGAEPFVTAGFGLWPHPVFANQNKHLSRNAPAPHLRPAGALSAALIPIPSWAWE